MVSRRTPFPGQVDLDPPVKPGDDGDSAASTPHRPHILPRVPGTRAFIRSERRPVLLAKHGPPGPRPARPHGLAVSPRNRPHAAGSRSHARAPPPAMFLGGLGRPPAGARHPPRR